MSRWITPCPWAYTPARRRHLPRDPSRVLHPSSLPIAEESLAERFPGVGHQRGEEQPVGLARVVEQKKARMGFFFRHMDLAEETVGPQRVGHLEPEDLDGRQSIMPGSSGRGRRWRYRRCREIARRGNSSPSAACTSGSTESDCMWG